jgi:hypothetical protein
VFSIFYLFVLFAALLIGHRGDSFSPMRASHAGRTGRLMHAELLPGVVRSADSSLNISAGEV